MLADQLDDQRTVLVAHPQPLEHAVGDRRTGLRVVAEPGTLPMSCSSAARSSRSGRFTSRNNPLARTTVSMRWRSTVCRWTALRCGRLRTAAHSGIHFSTTPARSSPSQTETSPGPVASRSPNTASAAGGHGVGIGGQFLARFCRVVGAMLTLLRAATSAARSDEQRVTGRLDARAEDRLAVGEEQAVAQRGHPRSTRTDAQGPGPLRLGGPAQRPVQRVRDEPGRGRHVGQQLVGVVVAEQRRRSVVVLTAQPVASSAGDDVHGVADVEQLLVGGVDGSVGPVGQPGGGQSAQDGHVAQPAAGLLEVRLEEVGEVALSRVPLRDLLLQLRQPCARVGAPVVGDGGLRRVDDVLLARDEGDVEQADGGRQVRPGHGPALVDGADAVVELHALVPDRVPEPVGQGGEVGRAEGPGLVEQDEVEVAERTPVAAGEAAHGGQGDSGSRRPAEASSQSSPSHCIPKWARAARLAGPAPGAEKLRVPARSSRREVTSVGLVTGSGPSSRARPEPASGCATDRPRRGSPVDRSVASSVVS